MSDDAPSADPFTLRDVFVGALAGLRADWRAHVGWNLAWICCAVLGCCGTTMALGVLLALFRIGSGIESDSRAPTSIGMVLGLYAVILPMMLGLYAIHQSVTMLLARGRARGTPLTMREAIEEGLRRTPALVGHLLARMLVEGTPIAIVYAIVFSLVWAPGTRVGGATSFGAGAWATMGIGYALVLVIGLGSRMWLGLAFPCVVVDGTGPIAAFGASSRLLEGRRWQFLRFRVAVFATWFLSYGVCAGPWVLFAGQGSRPDPALTLILLPMMLAFYAVALFLIVLDAATEACFHERITRPLDAASLARTFE